MIINNQIQLTEHLFFYYTIYFLIRKGRRTNDMYIPGYPNIEYL